MSQKPRASGLLNDEFKRQSSVIKGAIGRPKKGEMRTITVTKSSGLKIKFAPDKFEVKVTDGEVVISAKEKKD